MPRKRSPESNTDKISRLRLHGFLERVRGFLERTHGSVTSQRSRLDGGIKADITLLWKDAHEKLRGVVKSQEIGNPKWRRKGLADAGVFGEELGAKERLFDYISQDKRFLGALKLLASIFGSLSKVFPVLSAVKEFIDAVLCARDWLPDDPEITSLGDLR
jgi:hypothetical protein